MNPTMRKASIRHQDAHSHLSAPDLAMELCLTSHCQHAPWRHCRMQHSPHAHTHLRQGKCLLHLSYFASAATCTDLDLAVLAFMKRTHCDIQFHHTQQWRWRSASQDCEERKDCVYCRCNVDEVCEKGRQRGCTLPHACCRLCPHAFMKRTLYVEKRKSRRRWGDADADGWTSVGWGEEVWAWKEDTQ